MAELKQLQQLMVELGPAIELAGVVAYEGEDGRETSWSLLVDDDMELWAEFDPGLASLVMSAAVGQPDDTSRVELCETLLVYNGQRDLTGGVVMSLDEPGGEVVQSFTLPIAGLDLSRLSQVVGNFVEVWRGWRDIVAGGAEGASQEEGEPFEPPPDGMKI